MAFSVTEESAVDAWSCFWAGRGCMASGMEAAQLDAGLNRKGRLGENRLAWWRTT